MSLWVLSPTITTVEEGGNTLLCKVGNPTIRLGDVDEQDRYPIHVLPIGQRPQIGRIRYTVYPRYYG